LANEQRNEALKQKKSAEDEKDNALKLKEEAEKTRNEYKLKVDAAQKEKDEALARVAIAEKDREEALNVKKVAEDQKNSALADKSLAGEARQTAERQRDESESKSLTDSQERRIVEELLQKEINHRESTEVEYRNLQEVVKEVESIARFCSAIISNIFYPLESGDKFYTNASDAWLQAKTYLEKMKVIDSLNRAKSHYNTALLNVGKLDNVNKDTEQIKAYLKRAVEDSIGSIDIVITILKKILEDQSIPPEDKKRRGDLAAKKKLTADNTVIDVCNFILKLMHDYKEAFTKTQRGIVEDIKKNIEKKFKPETGDESVLNPRNK
jgi:DNA-binding ferritin-like protein (Dps family)